MGTKGYFAIVYKGKVYLSYSHFDAYPNRPGMGWTLVQDVQWGNIETWKRALDHIKVASGTPTEEDISALYPYTDLSVSRQSSNDWYCLTRKCQGSIAQTLRSGYFYGSIFPFQEEKLQDKLSSVEWSYIIDLDKNEFRTFQWKEIHFWRFPLDAIPLDTFGDASVNAFNRIANGKEFRYHDSGNEVVEAYKRFLEDEMMKLKEKAGGKSKTEDVDDETKQESKQTNKSSDNNPKDPKTQKTG